MWTKNKIRETFYDFFSKQHNHTIVKESSLLPPDDSLLFTNSGMNQFKDIFIGKQETQLTRACNIQKCVRTGGKHNDFDDVGKDTYHHTMFEMMGNWSFNYGMEVKGDVQPYYKKEAIQYAWELLVNVYGLDKSRIYVTYFGGYSNENVTIEPDNETKELWSQYLDESRILPFGMKENFWEMADTGPCGPCTEIHYDLIGDRTCPEKVNQDDPTVIELWNLVFMQYNRINANQFDKLKYCFVDTGMGFERLVCVLQNKMSNYDTDVFQPLYDLISKSTKVAYDTNEKTRITYRMIADHIRTMIYLIRDDVMPSKFGRGFIFVKLYERSCHYICQYLNFRTVYSLLVGEFLEYFCSIDPELNQRKNTIIYVFDQEEQKRGRPIWNSVVVLSKLLNKENRVLNRDEMLLLRNTRHVPESVIEMFMKENGFVYEK